MMQGVKLNALLTPCHNLHLWISSLKYISKVAKSSRLGKVRMNVLYRVVFLM